MTNLNKKILAAVLGGLGLVLVLWLSLRSFTTTVEFSKSDLQDRVEKFVEKNGMIGDALEFSSPVVLLEEEGNRVGLKVDVSASAYGKSGKGSLEATGTLTYKPEEGEFYISNLKIHEINLNGVPEYVMGMVTGFVQDGLNKLMPSIPVYTLREGNLKENAARLVLQKVEVKPGRLVATVGY